MSIDIGRCTSCYQEPCVKPGAKQRFPEQGCADWQGKEPFNWDGIEIEIVEKVKD